MSLVRYRISETTIDGPELHAGDPVAFKIVGQIADVSFPDEHDGTPTSALHVTDWAGPWPERTGPDAPVIPDRAIDAGAAAIEAAAHEADPDATEAELSRIFARAAMEGIARLVWPTHDETASLALSVARLDADKLRDVGDRMAAMLKSHEDLVALWRGVAHADWAAYHALQRTAEADAAPAGDG